jgi:hypothetical protein
MLALVLLLQQAGPTVGDTVWITQDIRVPRGMSVRPRPVTASPALEPLGTPEVVAEEREVTVRYPLVFWQPGRHTIELPGVILVRSDGWSDTLAPAVAIVDVRSVLPGPPSDTIPPRPAAQVVARTSPGLLPVLVLLLLAALLLIPLHGWWRRRGKSRKNSRESRVTRREKGTIDPAVLARWIEAGELRLAAEGWAQYLRQRLAVRDDAELAGLVEQLQAARFSSDEEANLSELLRQASRQASMVVPERDARTDSRLVTSD